MDLGHLDSLDASATLALAEELVLGRRRAERDDLRVVSHWAALHSTDPRGGRETRRVWCGEDRLVQVGGEGTPRVRELCLAELAVVREVHVLALRSVMADVLDAWRPLANRARRPRVCCPHSCSREVRTCRCRCIASDHAA